MNFFKRLSAVLLILAIVFSFAGCHKKGEIAVTVDGTQFTSGYYMCAFIFSDLQAQQMVNEQLGEDAVVEADFDYTKEKIEGKKYETWVKDNTISSLKIVALMKKLCKEADIVLGDDVIENSEFTAEYYWDSYGYSEIFGNNGVSKETFTQYMIDANYQETYFNHLYGDGGEDAIPEDSLKQAMQEKYYLANILEIDISDLDDATVLACQDDMRSYEDKLRNKKITFEEAYYIINEGEEKPTGDNLPKDPLATIVGNSESNYSSIYYSDLAAMEIGEVKYVDKTDDLKVAVLIKKDINEDPKYLADLDSELRRNIAGEKFEADMLKQAEELTADINNYAIKVFKVDKIVYPEYTEQ